jgi:hypothetical protein
METAINLVPPALLGQDARSLSGLGHKRRELPYTMRDSSARQETNLGLLWTPCEAKAFGRHTGGQLSFFEYLLCS